AGANNQTNTTFDVTVTRGGNTVFTGSSAPITLNSGVQDTLMTSTTYTPDTTGTYDFTFSGSADSATTNSQITKQLTVGDSVYSRDTDNWAGGFFMIAETCGGSEIGHAFDIYADQEATSISAFIVAAASVPGAIVQGKIYQSDLATVVAETDFYALDAADLGTLLTIPLLTPTTLLASDTTYIAVIGSFQSASDTVAIGSSGTVPPQTSFLLDVDDCNGQGAGTWFFVTGAPMVRLNFSKCAGFSVSTVKTDEDSTGASNGTATATATGGASPFTYVWNDANNQTTATATGLVSGPYIVTVTDGIGCVATSSIQIWITGIDDKNPLTSMAIYPNPNKGQFYIEFKNTVDDYFINAINVLGQTVYSKEIAVNGSYIKQIDLTHLEAGTYFITVSNADGERRTERIVIE
ncbi:T9SS type A sorting domain-containing protein, partial [Bacteroidales bacterium AH-315-I05]|nr:T9SS type A sorting domain-containing protein [Bacteroidales bacterium AH-315-I05]